MRILQVGACKGYDHVYEFVKNLSDSLIVLVEPMEFHQSDLKECYKDIILKNIVLIEQCCIVPPSTLEAADITVYYSVNDGPQFQVASINKNHVLKHGYAEDTIKTFSVKQHTLDFILNKYTLKALDYLFLDIEGIDADVILEFDISAYDIKNIQIEHLHLGDKTQAVRQKFFDAGYREVEAIGGVGFDTLFTKD